jgi:RND family efflux transporter MFP subunit
MSVALSSRRSFKGILPWAAVALCLTLLAASLVLHDTLFHGRAVRASPAPTDTAEQPAMSATVTLPEGKWKAAGVRTEPARKVKLSSEVAVAGRIEANTDCKVEIRPRASGVVREVAVKLGQKVKKGDLLAVLDSPDVGTARLNLRGRQIELATARKELDWKRQVAANVAQLIPELRKKTTAARIQKDYADRPLGADRARLLQAYSEFEIASHEAEKTSDFYRQKIIGEHPAFKAKHESEGAQAKLEAVLEQVKFDAEHEQTLAEQKVQLAEAAVIDAAERLKILGVSEDVTQLLARAGDVAAAKSSTADVTAYRVVAPFEGTILTRTAVPSQKADSSDVLFLLADLRTVWVTANITESDLVLVPGLKGGPIRLTVTAYPDRTFEAKLLSVGAMVDPTTRTVPLLAETANPDDLLKLGMFARIVLDAPATDDVLTIPASAVVEIEERPGVFIPSGHDGRSYTFHPIRPGRQTGDRRVIAGGLAQGDPVVCSGAFFLKSELILQNEPEED